VLLDSQIGFSGANNAAMKQKPDIQNQILGELNKINLQLSSIQQTLANNTNVIEELKNFFY